jgi:D-alanyl-D-alanine endopeptidase (penicillin-binding protein 7)
MRGSTRAGWFLVLFLFLVAAVACEYAEAKPRSGRSVAPVKGKAKRTLQVRAMTVKKARAAKKRSVHRKYGTGKRSPARLKEPARATAGHALRVTASAAFVIDQETGEVLVGKNAGAVLPIASLTKLMTALVVAESGLPLDETIRITADDVDRIKGSSSRLAIGTVLTRRQALRLALMSSENRAAHALARTYPGGEAAFVNAMNLKAGQLQMHHTRYVEPTGLSSRNRSSARDLALLAKAAYEEPLLRRFSTAPRYRLETKRGPTQYVNSNRLVRSGTWDIGLQKTGYISEAGPCLLMQVRLAGRKLIMVLLDSASKLARVRDAERVRRWLAAKKPPETRKPSGSSSPL